ncbi:hypothetical protein RB195_002672 [Necator americanus]|uniref:Guanylate cyclase domain-containing protein n=1 Tax=Necator americanus TaxID=51031 RepID=A0ABR1DK50_NECAM
MLVASGDALASEEHKHAFLTLTTNVTQSVENQSRELVEEKKKADILLGKMLPRCLNIVITISHSPFYHIVVDVDLSNVAVIRQVAERLKLGQSVQPEGFDNVTVLFSDIVRFTQLSAKCMPLQVESIGDGYLCVSGLPLRNGFNHIREIVEMSLSFMDYVNRFRIPNLSKERIELRIGINSGPCVAGVVGLSMPRYCLFGDTVNTASRMESNGRASHIHMSSAARNLLVENFPGHYDVVPRGETIIKGKGVMETYWVMGRNDHDSTLSQSTLMSTTRPTTTSSEHVCFTKEEIKEVTSEACERTDPPTRNL